MSDRVGADLAAIEARLAKATPGPWEFEPEQATDTAYQPARVVLSVSADYWSQDCNEMVLAQGCDADADLIAHAPADIATLLAEVSRLGQQLQRTEDMARDANAECIKHWNRADAAEAERDGALALVGQLQAENQRLRDSQAMHREWADAQTDRANTAVSQVGQLQGQLAAAERDRAVCNGLCLTAADVGVPVQDNPVAHAHLSCSLHGDPAELGRRADRLLDEVRGERDGARRQLDAVRAVAKAMRRASTLTGWADRIDSAAAAVLSDREGTQ